MPTCFQCAPNRLRHPPFNRHLCTRSLNAEPGCFNRRLYIHAVIQHIGQKLHRRLLNPPASRRTQRRKKCAISKYQHRRQTHIHLFVGRNTIWTIGHQIAPPNKIVQKHARIAHHHPRPKPRPQTLGYSHSIAIAINHIEMRRAFIAPCRWIARFNLTWQLRRWIPLAPMHTRAISNQLSAFCRIALRQQSFNRCLRSSRVFYPICIAQLHGFDEQVYCLLRVVFHLRQIVSFQHIERFQNLKSRTRRRWAKYLIAAIGRRYRIDPFRFKIRQIALGQPAPFPLNISRHFTREIAAIKNLCSPFSDPSKRPRQILLNENLPRQWSAPTR